MLAASLSSALEIVLLSVLTALEADMAATRKLIGNLLAVLEDDIDRDKFKRLLHYSRKLDRFQNRAKLVRAWIYASIPRQFS